MKAVQILMTTALLLTCSGCSSSSDSDKDAEIAALKQQVQELQSQLGTTSADASESSSGSSVKDNTASVQDNEGSVEPVSFTLGQPITCDGIFEMTLNDAEWTDTVEPSNTSGYYSYYDDVEGEKYFVISGTIKNISGNTIDVQFGSTSQMVFNDTYTYGASWEAEGSDHSDFYGYQISPLTTTNTLFCVSVPDEVKTNFEKCTLTFGFDDLTTYVSNLNDCKHIYTITVN